jgi:hypothetical protein
MGRTCPASGQAFLREDDAMAYLLTTLITGIIRLITGT